MHFIGIQALIVPGMLAWDATLVVASLVIGMVLGSAALVAYHQLEPRKAPWAAAGLLMLAICGMHFTAMGAATIVPDPTVVVEPTVINSATLAIGVAGITMLVIVAALAMAVIDAQAERALPARNRQLVDAARDGLIVAKDGRIVNVNRRILELSGWSSSELLGKSVADDLVAGAVRRVPTASIKAREAFLKTASPPFSQWPFWVA